MKYFLILLSLIGFVTLGHAQIDQKPEPWTIESAVKELDALSKQATLANYPNADVVSLIENSRATYFKDGTSKDFTESYQKILTERGRKESSTYSRSYMEIYTRVKPVAVKVISPDGAVRIIDLKKAASISTENSSMAANIYSDKNKQLTINIPDLKINDIVYIATEEEQHKTRIPDFYANIGIFEYTMPILRSSYEIIGPADMPLKHIAIRNPNAKSPIVSHKKALPDGRISYTWQARDIDQIFEEPAMPTLYTQVQRIIVSSGDSWEALSKWYWNLCTPHLDSNPAMEAKVKELTAKAKSFDDRVKAIFTFVSQEIRYMGIFAEDTAPGLEPHDATLTFNNRYGVCRDKALLLVQMLRLAGFEAYPVIFNAGTKLDTQVPTPFFNHAITAVRRPDGSLQLMDTTDETTRDLFPAYLADSNYLVAMPEGATLMRSPVLPASSNEVYIETTATLSPENSLSLTSEMTFLGINDNIYRSIFIDNQPADQRRILDGLVRGTLPGATLDSYTVTPKNPQDMTQPLKLVIKATIPDFAVINDDGTAMIRLPWLSSRIGYANFLLQSLSLDKRRFDMTLNSTAEVREGLSIKGLDALGKSIYLPSDKQVDSAGFTYARSTKIDTDKQMLVAKSRLALTKMTYTPADYQALQKSVAAVQQDSQRKPLFKKSLAQSADSEILESKIDITLTSPTAYSIAGTQTRKILTYTGKKENAELFFSYTPKNETFTVTDVYVTTAGKKNLVTDKEINIMDANWVAGAPRYPVAKTMVVALPSVEVGSTTHYATERHIKQSRAFNYQMTPAGLTPINNFSLSIKVPLAFNDSYTPSVINDPTGSIKYTYTTTDEMAIHSWSCKTIDALPREEATPAGQWYLPTIRFTANHKLINRDRAALIDSIEATLDQAEDNETITALAKRLTKDLNSYEQIVAIRDFVAQKIRGAGPSLWSLPPWTLSSPTQTLTDGYGNDIDRALLLTALYDAADIDSEIIFVAGTKDPASIAYSKAYSPAQLFTIPLVKVEDDANDQTYFVGDGNEYSQLGTSSLIGHPYWAIDHGTKEKAFKKTISAVGPNQIQQTRHVALKADGSAIVITGATFLGTAFTSLNQTYSQMQPEDRRRHELALANQEMQGAKIVDTYEVQHTVYPGLTNLAVSVPNYAAVDATEDQTSAIMTIPVKSLMKKLFPIRGVTRKSPLARHHSEPITQTTTWILPAETSRILMKPSDIHWIIPTNPLPGAKHTEAEVFSMKWTQETIPSGQIRLTCITTYNPQTGTIDPIIYPALLDMNKKLAHPSMANIVIELKQTKASK